LRTIPLIAWLLAGLFVPPGLGALVGIRNLPAGIAVFVLLQLFFSGAAAMLLREEGGVRIGLTAVIGVGMFLAQCAVLFGMRGAMLVFQ
jgi:hypothetical protein